jgi:hypothetical protein
MTGKTQYGTDDVSRHVGMFKAFWGKPETARSFLETCLPEEVPHHVDLSILTTEPDHPQESVCGCSRFRVRCLSRL